MKRRFLSPLPEFRSILYTSPNSVTLVCLSSDGKCIFLLCTLQGSLKVLYRINPNYKDKDNESLSNDKITAIKVVKGDRLVYGTFNGHIKIINLKTGDHIEDEKEIIDNPNQSNHHQPILQIANENVHVDSDGKLFVNGIIVLDDRILQPCSLFIEDKNEIHSIYLVKFRTIYRYEILSKHLQTFNLDSSVYGYFCASELFIENIDNVVNNADTFNFKTSLVLITDQGELFTLSSESDTNKTFSIKKMISSTQSLEQSPSQSPSQDDNESESESENDDSDYANENDTESPEKSDQFRIFGLIKYPWGNKNNNHLIKLNVNLLQKRAHVEVIKYGINNINISSDCEDVIVEFPLVNVVCPLCTSVSSSSSSSSTTTTQTLPLNTLNCLQGHPLTICSLSATLIPSITSFRCRSCRAAYSCNPSQCHFCPGLLTKIN